MFKKNKILIISIVAIIILVSFLFYQRTKENKLLSTYHNQTYNYSFKYPKYLEQSAHCSGNDDPVLIDKASQVSDVNADFVSVVTSPQTFASLDQWLQKENDYWQKHDQKRIVEKKIKIDGNFAFVTYLESNYPNSEISNQSQVVIEKGQSKKTVFVKDSVLFEINTRFITNPAGQNNIWRSFKIADFTKKFPDIYRYDNLYVNDKYHYFFNYPEGIIMSDYCVGDPDSVSFEDNHIEGLGIIHISVLENTSFKTIKQWQEVENAKSTMYYQKFERNILIDNYSAQVFSMAGKSPLYEDEPYSKRAVFIKDNNLFIISIYFGEEKDHQTIWDNFKFIDQNISQIENWSLYKEINKQNLEYDVFGDPNNCAQEPNFNQEFAKFKATANQGSIKKFVYNGVLELAITPNYNNWTNEKFLAFSTDNGAFCGMGGFFPLQAYSDRLLWSGGCGPKTFSEEDIANSIKCEKIDQAVFDYFKVN